MSTDRNISVPAIRIVESLSRNLHTAETYLDQVRDEQEKAYVADLILEMKQLIGKFFREHIDRRTVDRGTSPISDYERYFAGKQTYTEESPPSCPFCDSNQVVFRRKDLHGNLYWYCTSCRQEIQS